MVLIIENVALVLNKKKPKENKERGKNLIYLPDLPEKKEDVATEEKLLPVREKLLESQDEKPLWEVKGEM